MIYANKKSPQRLKKNERGPKDVPLMRTESPVWETRDHLGRNCFLQREDRIAVTLPDPNLSF